ncbi:unnamed protein product [Tilletia caries]|uniref:Uncharacterized protein n=1 Tax=Tilletia caries TaxID=13290 RepID=A0ABN7IVK2_9BASI|nr:unnamed protein product [Tilletia caries]CAD6946976.1 unnamed protein product [Tilletia caries]
MKTDSVDWNTSEEKLCATTNAQPMSLHVDRDDTYATKNLVDAAKERCASEWSDSMTGTKTKQMRGGGGPIDLDMIP